MVYDVKPVKNFKELLNSSAEEFGTKEAFVLKQDGLVREVSYKELRNDVRALASYIRTFVPDNATVALVGPNGYSWAIGYLAVTCGVGIVVPIDKELKKDDVLGIVNTSEASAIICADGYKTDLSDSPVPVINLTDLQNILAKGRQLLKKSDPYKEHRIDPDALGVLLFTSGTSGASKGVMLSQYNICADIMCVLKKVRVTSEDRVLSVLPLSHTYECTAGFLAMLYAGGSISYVESLRKLLSDFQLYKPTIFIAVPLVLQTIYSTLRKKIDGNKSKSLQFKAAGVVTKTLGAVKIDVKKKLYREIHGAFGGKLRLILCGGAALDPELNRAFTDLGFRVCCGYGLTETSPILLGDNDFYNNPETSGVPFCSIQAKIDSPDSDGVGELIAKGPTVMLGYYKNPEETANAIVNGWFHTGDLARKNKDGSFTVVGRCKSMIVKSNGKKVLPEELEEKLDACRYIAESLVFGETCEDGHTEICAAIYPDKDEVNKKFAEQSVPAGGAEYEKALYDLIYGEVKKINSTLPPFKHIHTVRVRKTEFVKTPSKKIKRAEKSNFTAN